MIEIDKEKCRGCNYCTLFCGEDALSYIDYEIVVDIKKCKLCGACTLYCPIKAIELIKDD